MKIVDGCYYYFQYLTPGLPEEDFWNVSGGGVSKSVLTLFINVETLTAFKSLTVIKLGYDYRHQGSL